ncbi:MAG: NosD domain-containing protein [Candidatus Bathyarchaeia archaeon]
MKIEAIVCPILVVLLLVSVFHLTGLQLPNCEGAGSGQRIDDVQSRTIEHRITGSELQLLKSRIGVKEENQSYNQIVFSHGTGLAPPSEADWEKIGKEAYVVDQVTSNTSLPSNVDNSATPWFPPIGNQGSQGSCVAWAVGYYTKTFQEAKEHNWSVSGTTSDEIMSPSFIYNLIDNGVDQGSNYYDAIQLVCSVGDCSLAKMPYNAADCTSWPPEQAWSEAPFYRGNYSGYETLLLTTDAGLASLKNWIASGNLAIIAVDASQYVNLSSNDIWTVSNYVNPSTGHANTIVGYDGNVQYTEEGQLRQGAFKIANSWGVGWTGDHNSDGFYWISYKAMEQRVEYCMFYRDRIGYVPTLTCSFEIEHPMRGECSIVIGMGTHDNPTMSKSFTEYIEGGNQPFCSNNIVFDITEFEDAVPNVYGKPFFLSVYDGGSPTTGTILYFSVENTVSSNPPVTTVNGGYVFVDLTLVGTIYIRADGSIDPPSAPIQRVGDSYTINLDLYDWSIIVEKDNITIDGAGHTLLGAGSGYGIDLSNRTNVIATNTQIQGFSIGVYTHNSSGLIISNNNITENNDGIFAILDMFDSRQPELLSIIGNNITKNSDCGIYAAGMRDSTISRNVVSDNGIGIGFGYSSYGGPGIYGSCYNSISLNTVMDNTRGFSWALAYCNVVSGNQIAGNEEYGVWMSSSSNNKFSENNVSDDACGFYLEPSYNYIWGFIYSVNNTLAKNNLTGNNQFGIQLINVSGNFIYHNNFADNTQEVQSTNSSNTWDNGYPSGGNYWSGYTDVDLFKGLNQNVPGSDGIWDHPYVIDANNTDHYPLVNPWISIESLVVRGMDSRIYYRIWNGASWEGWNVLPGSTIDSPAAAILGNQLYVVVRGSDGNSLWYGYLTNITNPGSFSGWTMLSGATSSAPTLTSNGTALCLMVRGLDNRIYYRVYDTVAQVWQGWNALPSGATCDKPAAAMLGSTLNIVVRGYSPTDSSMNNTLWYSTVDLTNNAFSGWTLLSGATPSSPTLTASQTSNSLYLTVRGNDNKIYVNTWNGGNWQGWNVLPTGTTIDGPAATIVGTKLFFVVVGMDGTSMWQSSLDLATSSFSGWTPLSGATPSAPTLAG